MNIFVYGTLMTGLQRQHALSSSHFLGNGSIAGELYDLGRFPALIKGSSKVFGELYDISEQTLSHLDQIESYDGENPEGSLYIRREVEFYLNPDAEPVTAESYFYNKSVEGLGSLIIGGNYRIYLDERGFSDWL